MAGGDKSVTYAIQIKATSNAGEAAKGVDALREGVATSADAIKQYSAALRNLRGSSDEVKAAKVALKTAIQAERDKVSQGTLALHQMGATLKDVKAKTEESTGAVGQLKEALTVANGATLGLIAGAVGLVGAFGSVATSLVKWGLEAGNARRSQQLLLEAASGSAENAAHLAHQIDALTGKVPQSREELTKLNLELVRMANGTRLSGQATVDTFNAVAVTSAAMGDSAGKAIQDIITRGRQLGRFGLGFQELQGGLGGLSFGDVAKQLSKDLKISEADASARLSSMRVKLDDGAKAIREVVERRFGGIAKRQMLDLNVQAQKFKDNLAALVEDVDLTPILSGFKTFSDYFSKATDTGVLLKKAVTGIGEILMKGFELAKPVLKAVAATLIELGLNAAVVVVKAFVWLRDTFGGSLKHFDAVNAAVWATRVAFVAITGPIAAAAATIALFTGFAVAIVQSVRAIPDVFTRVAKAFGEIDWRSLGRSILVGLTAGLSEAVPDLIKRVGDVASKVKEGFKGALGIHSPSAVFAEYGRQTTAGYEKGLAEGSGSAATAAAAAAPTPPALPAAGRPSGAASTPAVTVHVNAHFPNAKDGAEVAAALTGASFKAQLVRALEEVARGIGAPTGVPT